MQFLLTTSYLFVEITLQIFGIHTYFILVSLFTTGKFVRRFKPYHIRRWILEYPGEEAIKMRDLRGLTHFTQNTLIWKFLGRQTASLEDMCALPFTGLRQCHFSHTMTPVPLGTGWQNYWSTPSRQIYNTIYGICKHCFIDLYCCRKLAILQRI